MIDPMRLHAEWPFLVRGLADIQRKAHGKTRWWLEDVYAAIQTRQATAYIVSVGDAPAGFFVVHPQQVPFSGETELFLWIVWSIPLRERNGADYAAVTHETLQFIAALALQGGHSAVATLTVRPGLLRRFGNLWQSEVISARMDNTVLHQLVGGN
jgi:hypothetical protein